MVQEEEKATPVYIRSVEHAWIPALQLKVARGKANVIVPKFAKQDDLLQCEAPSRKNRYGDNQLIDLKDYPNGVLPMQNVDANGRLEDFKEMVDLPSMSEAAILYNLKLRHQREKPYTRTGDIVIAVNPYKWFHELYTPEKQCYYANRLVFDRSSQEDPRATMEPHAYEISSLAYKGLTAAAMGNDGENQSILVSGESGAGKTETVKICLNHIARVQQGPVNPSYYTYDENPVVRRVVESNPLLEAFGNAKTRRNDNSSRFGKYLQMQFDKSRRNDSGMPTLVGSKCDVYLLEKNRAVGHDAHERNFHIFYQLLASDNKERFWEGLANTTNESFKYIGPTATNTIEGMKDGDRFQETLNALALVNVQGESLDTLMKALCVTLQLGNLGFAMRNGDADQSMVTTPKELSALGQLMGVSEPDLVLAFTERTFKTAKETHKVPLNPDAAKEACDALAKEIYQKAFLWLVNTINKATSADETDGTNYGTIGLLDIFGFESFDVNRFEQLCINYANEKLQQKFTEDVFANVQAEYKSEGIAIEDIRYDDNTDVLDLIEGKTGLLNLLTEECIRPKGNDFDFVQKALQINKSSPALVVNRTDRLSFAIQHYAGPVMYSGESFVSKNLDTLPTDLQECAEKCTNDIIRAPRSDPAPKRTGMRWGNSTESNINSGTVWSKYKTQLSSLMASLRKTKSRYIRCIKPNNQKQPHLMAHKETVEQLRCAGVVAAISIARSYFPNRLPNSVVLARYSNLMDPINHPSRKTNNMTLDEKRAEDCKALLDAALIAKMQFDADGKPIKPFAVGKTKTFFRAGAMEFLEGNRVQGLDKSAATIQRAARGWLTRNKGRHEKQRKQMEEAHRRARLERQVQLEREREKERAAETAERLRELQDLEAMCDHLEEEQRRANKHSQDVLKLIYESNHQSKQELDELKKSLEAIEKHEITARRVELARQEKQLEENIKLINMLKKENKRVRKENARYTGKRDQEMSNHEILEDTLRDLSEGVDTWEELHIREEAHNGSLMSEYEQAKIMNRDLKCQFRSQQAGYLEQANARLELQKLLAKVILTIDGHKKKPNHLVLEINAIVQNVEGMAKSEMAALDAEFTDPCPQGEYTETGSDETE